MAATTGAQLYYTSPIQPCGRPGSMEKEGVRNSISSQENPDSGRLNEKKPTHVDGVSNSLRAISHEDDSVKAFTELNLNEGTMKTTQTNIVLSPKIIWYPELDATISQAHYDRFNRELVPFLATSLSGYLKKKKVFSGPIAIELKMIGTAPEEAQPTIVVMCKPKVKSRVKRFFEQEGVREQYRPTQTISQLPCFALRIWGKAPIELAATSITSAYLEQSVLTNLYYENMSFCGCPVKIETETGTPKIATIGGIIRIKIDSSTPDIFYGVTAGHLTQETGSENLFDEIGSESEGDENLDSDSEGDLESDGDVEIGHLPGHTEPSSTRSFTDSLASEVTETPQEGLPERSECHSTPSATASSVLELLTWGETRGIVVAFELDGYSNLDWALYGLPEFAIKPPIPNSYGGNLITTIAPSNSDTQPREVIIAGGISGMSRGLLVQNTSFILSSSATRTTRAFRVRVTEGRGVTQGDSGSWVFNGHELYGHVVAMNAFGEAYVVPASYTLSEIKWATGAYSVSLHYNEDITKVGTNDEKISVYNIHRSLNTLSRMPSVDDQQQPDQTHTPRVHPDIDSSLDRIGDQIPCDACRRRKSRCVMNGDSSICVLCRFNKRDCTFLQRSQPRKNPSATDGTQSSMIPQQTSSFFGLEWGPEYQEPGVNYYGSGSEQLGF